MEYFADYEALEFENINAKKLGIYPYYLYDKLTEQSLCPIFFSACNNKGELIASQNCFKTNISFLKFLDKEIDYYKRSQRNILRVWFHNVKYDARIIMYELFHNNFKHIFDSETIEYIGEHETYAAKGFSIVGENLSKYIGLNIYYRGFKILVRDSMSILNSAQDKILKDFGYSSKIDVDWQSITIDNLKDNMQLIEDRNTYDVISLSRCINEFRQAFFEKFHGRGGTAASMSLDALKNYFCLVKGYHQQEIDHDIKKECFRQLYPQLTGVDKDISAGGYSGGICTVNDIHQGKVIHDIQMVDINSSYPFAMTKPLPFGKGIEIKGFVDITKSYAEYVVYIDFKHRGIPFLRCNSENKARDILNLDRKNKVHSRSELPQEFKGYLCVNSIDLDTLQTYATVKKLEFKKGFLYNTNTDIANFILPIYDERKHSKGTEKMAIKLLLNSLYGKFAQDLSGIVNSYYKNDDKGDMYDYDQIVAIDTDTIYKPLASAVTAYARRNLIDVIYALGDDFIYSDTDSVYFKNPEINMQKLKQLDFIHENALGKWSTEYDNIHKGKFLSKKNYIIEVSNSIKLTCVGLSSRYHNQVNFDNFELNSAPFEIWKMVNVYGGKAMRQTEFTIKERNF